MVRISEYGELDDLADAARTQQDLVAGMQRLGLAVLPQPVGEGQIVRARLPGLRSCRLNTPSAGVR